MIDIRLGDCLEILPTLTSESVDCVLADPPYPEIDRDYGRLTEDEWRALMMGVCRELRRVLKPTGSAVFILQPNSHKVGSMRGWLWEFMAWACREWNMVQDVWWWNFAALPSASVRYGLTRSSLKACVWLGPADCYRNQKAVLWSESEQSVARRLSNRVDALVGTRMSPSGRSVNRESMAEAIAKNGGVSPFNVIPLTNTSNGHTSAASDGHGAGTPIELARWWTRYICPPGGTVLDPFFGAGTMGLAALEYGNSIIGIEKMEKYYLVSRSRLGV